jgi:hypothetical protein
MAKFEQVWRPSGNWALLVQPAEARASGGTERARDAAPEAAAQQTDSPAQTDPAEHAAPMADPICDDAIDKALDEMGRRGLDTTADLLAQVAAMCPGSSRAVSELAAVRFADRAWKEAESLAERAVRLDPSNTYAWDVLGSSRFMQNDARGALEAWNRLEKPRLDSVRIAGLAHTRYALVARTLALVPNELLSAEAFARAGRTLQELPTRSSARIDLRPDADGFTVVDVAIVERQFGPRGAVEWGAGVTQALVNREVSATIPGWTGQGEAWTAALRWWPARPRAALNFSVPRTGFLPGIWRVSGSWERETYSATGDADGDARDERTHAGLAIANWLTSQLRYELFGSVDSWRSVGRTASIGAAIERRLWDDRMALRVSGQNWFPVGHAPAFRAASMHAILRSRIEDTGTVHMLRLRGDVASDTAPRAIWSGAREGQARPGLLRAHPLLDDGVIDGPVFGRNVAQMTVESRRWLNGPPVIRLGIAAFVDVAHAWKRGFAATGDPLQADAGAGIRIRMPGREGTLRIDYARGLRDGAGALTFGWTSLECCRP